ncbi:dihydrouridine synthase [Streptomyces uncialis]|uniref:dihydrouridine synthase n=1 Tax=Streptomyces uncialis TaxID=1048205 RepID=UPI002F94AE14|nr:dihydrouridine synthase [Streptomyces uncialis]
MLLAATLITAGVLLRQADRAHFARRRPHAAPSADLIALQRARANNLTPLLLLAGQWVQITGWWFLTAHGPLAAAAAALGVAVHFRHLQEISHFAVHGVLARTPRANLLLAEVFAHHPLALGPVPARRRRHVRDHHPNATLPGADPNLAELHQAGLRPGTTTLRFAAALVHPLTPSGIRATLASVAGGLGHSPARAAAAVAVLAAAYAAGGWTAVICGVLVPRLLLYPQLAWLSLLGEHTWFDPEHRTGTPAQIEAGRCLRLYPRNRILATIAATTWLPYGDLHHYPHSAHPAVRWNYLPALERHLTPPHFTPDSLLIGARSVARRHHRALTTPAPTPAAPGRAAPTV